MLHTLIAIGNGHCEEVRSRFGRIYVLIKARRNKFTFPLAFLFFLLKKITIKNRGGMHVVLWQTCNTAMDGVVCAVDEILWTFKFKAIQWFGVWLSSSAIIEHSLLRFRYVWIVSFERILKICTFPHSSLLFRCTYGGAILKGEKISHHTAVVALPKMARTEKGWGEGE